MSRDVERLPHRIARHDTDGPATVAGKAGSVRTCAAPEVTTVRWEGFKPMSPMACQEEQAPEPLFEVALEEAGAGAEGFRFRDQPEMRDAGGGQFPLGEVGEKGVIALAPVFGGKGVGVVRGAGESVAGVDGDDAVIGGAEALDGGAGEAGFVGEDEPGEGFPEFGFHIDRAIGASHASRSCSRSRSQSRRVGSGQLGDDGGCPAFDEIGCAGTGRSAGGRGALARPKAGSGRVPPRRPRGGRGWR